MGCAFGDMLSDRVEGGEVHMLPLADDLLSLISLIDLFFLFFRRVLSIFCQFLEGLQSKLAGFFTLLGL